LFGPVFIATRLDRDGHHRGGTARAEQARMTAYCLGAQSWLALI
jgi:hypothetical protein